MPADRNISGRDGLVLSRNGPLPGAHGITPREVVAAGAGGDQAPAAARSHPSKIGNRENLLGRSFGEWLVIAPIFEAGRRSRWMVRCSCGTERDILAQSLINGASTSCGCRTANVRAVRHQAHIARAALLTKALAHFGHKDDCSGWHEWTDTADHFRTTFGFLINADSCGCGAIALALELDPSARQRMESGK